MEDLIKSLILDTIRKENYVENAYEDDDGIIITDVYGKQYLVSIKGL